MPPIMLPAILGVLSFHIERLPLSISHADKQQSQHLTGRIYLAALQSAWLVNAFGQHADWC